MPSSENPMCLKLIQNQDFTLKVIIRLHQPLLFPSQLHLSASQWQAQRRQGYEKNSRNHSTFKHFWFDRQIPQLTFFIIRLTSLSNNPRRHCLANSEVAKWILQKTIIVDLCMRLRKKKKKQIKIRPLIREQPNQAACEGCPNK